MPSYNPARDGQDSYTLALYMLALLHGSRRAATPWEMYWLEKQGLMP
jgi:hypothetical protein